MSVRKIVFQTISTCCVHGQGVVFGVSVPATGEEKLYCPICRPDHSCNPVAGLRGLNLFPKESS